MASTFYLSLPPPAHLSSPLTLFLQPSSEPSRAP
jgi:hypothetical protein